MRNLKRTIAIAALATAGFVGGLLAESRMQRVQAQAMSSAAFPAVPGFKGGEDITGPYEPVVDWPQLLTSLPGHQNWTR
jgi:hypothetical protein